MCTSTARNVHQSALRGKQITHTQRAKTGRRACGCLVQPSKLGKCPYMPHIWPGPKPDPKAMDHPHPEERKHFPNAHASNVHNQNSACDLNARRTFLPASGILHLGEELPAQVEAILVAGAQQAFVLRLLQVPRPAPRRHRRLAQLLQGRLLVATPKPPPHSISWDTLTYNRRGKCQQFYPWGSLVVETILVTCKGRRRNAQGPSKNTHTHTSGHTHTHTDVIFTQSSSLSKASASEGSGTGRLRSPSTETSPLTASTARTAQRAESPAGGCTRHSISPPGNFRIQKG